MRLEKHPVLCALTVLAAIGWWVGFVSPHDKHQRAVAECVHQRGDMTDQAAWETCHNRLVPSASGLVPYLTPATR